MSVLRDRAVLSLAATLLIPYAAMGGPAMVVDGLFEDWAGSGPAWTDPSGDRAAGGAIDLGRLWVSSDDERITIRFETGTDMSLQGGNALALFLDGDADGSTGHPIGGIGAELSWTFGQRTGTVWSGGKEIVVRQADIGLRQAPTVTSKEFEVSFLRTTADGVAVAPGPNASLVLVDEGFAGGDRLPDVTGRTEATAGVPFELHGDPAPHLWTVGMERDDPGDIRVLTWNVLFDGLFKRPAPFIRVLRALDPDVICFQEIWSHTSQQAADQVALALPGAEWHAASSGEGHILSRYPITLERSIDESGNCWALVDLPDERYDVDISVVSAHPPCCEKEAERQQELDGIASWIRELVEPGGVLSAPGQPPLEHDLPHGTPFVIAGDMNLVGGARQVLTLTDGAIVDEAAFGPSRAPDWDGTPLADAWPRVIGDGGVYTWRDTRSSFSPGKLDYIIYSDSVLRLSKAFVLETSELSVGELEAYGLRREDTVEASDHLPVVADFAPVSRGRDAVTPADAPAQREAAE